MAFEINIPSKLTFQDYLTICQTSRTLADAYDRKDKARLYAAIAPTVSLDYSGVVPSWVPKTVSGEEFVEDFLSPNHLGVTALATQHLLGVPYFHSVTDDEIVVEWQQLASHGRRVAGDNWKSPSCRISEVSDGRSYMKQNFVKVDGQWKICGIRPEVLYHTGNFKEIGRPNGPDEKSGWKS